MQEIEGHRAARILIVDDDRPCVAAIADLLREAGHEVRAIWDPRGAVQLAESYRPDVILLDVVMPHVDGFSLCIDLRRHVSSAVLMLSAKGDAQDRTVGLRVGADDYLRKPFDASELEARVGALIRRQQRARREPPRWIGSLVIDRRSVRAWTNGTLLDLTPTEFRLLDVLTASPGRVFTREELLRVVFGGRVSQPTRAVDVHMGRLRRKLEASGVDGVQVRARRGFGYSAHRLPDPVEVTRPTTPRLLPAASVAAMSAA
jgi:DNA-binding response OmpR family regulator